ncbi:MAG: SufD family Fe-S cluster assembly protein, partial [Prevotella sp.]|nr:SufD family Fe-S cluster assembly protein [Prevotella sp.]
TLIAHHVAECKSTELYKYVLDDQSVGAFAGRVLVKHGAQKTESQMRNQNLCATREARMFTRPMLEIAFINEVIDQIELVPLRDRLHYLVEKRFRGELSKCVGCKLCQ